MPIERAGRGDHPHEPDQPESPERRLARESADVSRPARDPLEPGAFDDLYERVSERRSERSGEGADDPGRLRDLGRLFGRGGADSGDRPEPGDQPASKTWLETDTRPPPVDTTRVCHRTGYLDPPLPREQESLDRTVPRDSSGDPVRFPNPKDQWSSEVNGDGRNINVFRRNNCLDCSLAAISTWHGEPRVSAPRHAEYDASGAHNDTTGEIDGPERAQRWLGHKYESIGPDASAYNEISRRLTDAGHGASAAIIGGWPWGGGHAWNAFNHEGKVYWVDTQLSDVSEKPLHGPAINVKAIIMNSEGKKA